MAGETGLSAEFEVREDPGVLLGSANGTPLGFPKGPEICSIVATVH